MPLQTAPNTHRSPLREAPARRPGDRRHAGLTVVGREVELVVNGRASGNSGRDVVAEATAVLQAEIGRAHV